MPSQPSLPFAYVRHALIAVVLSGVVPLGASAQVYPDLVSRTALRVCSDPSNMPFSDRKLQGFENKIAAIVADRLKEPVRYFWAPSGPGFIRNTLNSDLCDVVMGYTVGSEMVQPTNPYYRSTYVIVARKGSDLNGVVSIADPKLRGHRLGVFAATPPVDVMLAKGLMDRAVVYPLIVDHRFNSPLQTMLGDLESGKIDAAVVWGPLVGLSVKNSSGALVMTPLSSDAEKPGFSYRISFGVRHDEVDWKHKLERVLRSRKADIDKVLVEYDVPLVDNIGHLIPAKAAESGASPKIEPASANGHHTSVASPQGMAPFKMPGPPPVNAPAAARP